MIVASLKILHRDVMALFWAFLFPILLFAFFSSLSGGGEPTIYIYIKNGTNNILNSIIVSALKSNNTIIEYINTDNPKSYLLNTTYIRGRLGVLIAIGNSTVEIYSTSALGPIVAGTVKGALSPPVKPLANVTYVDLGAGDILRVENEVLLVRLALSLALFNIAILTGLLASFIITGYAKRLFLSPTGKISVLLQLTTATIIYSLESVVVLFLVAEFMGYSAATLLSPAFYPAFFINAAFSAGLTLLISALDVKFGSSRMQAPASIPIFLFFAFLSGYYTPAEFLTGTMADLAKSLPPYYTRMFVEGAVLHGIYQWSLLYQPAAVAVALLVIGLYIHPLVKRP